MLWFGCWLILFLFIFIDFLSLWLRSSFLLGSFLLWSLLLRWLVFDCLINEGELSCNGCEDWLVVDSFAPAGDTGILNTPLLVKELFGIDLAI